MGVLTRDAIVAAGLQLAGDSSLTSIAEQGLNDWLRATYREWPWPFLQDELVGLSLVTGAQSVSIGNGAGGVTHRIQRVFDPIYLYNSGYTVRARARVAALRGGSEQFNPSIQDPATNRGLPSSFIVRPDTTAEDRLKLVPWPVPDKDYLLHVQYQKVPAHLAAGTDVPPYSDDQTLIQAVCVKALEFLAVTDSDIRKRLIDERNTLRDYVRNNQATFGVQAGWLDTLELDDNVFR